MDGVDTVRIQQLFEFTEHHRYYCYRDFALSTVDYRMLALIYKPLVGAFAISLYEQLCMSIPDGKTGYSSIEPHRKLLLSIGLALNEKNRSFLLEQLSKLEAVNLLQSSRFVTSEQSDFIYEYELQKPLSPDEFFKNIHFMMLLRDKLGKYAVIDIREQLHAAAPQEVVDIPYEKEQLSTPFYELFHLNATVIDDELEQALKEVAPARQTPTVPSQVSAGYTLAEILLRFPRNSHHRYYVEQLKNNAEQMAMINYIAYKYELSVPQICRLLDEDGVFDVGGALDVDHMQRLALQFFRQDQRHEQNRNAVFAKQVKLHEQDQQDIIDSPEVDVEEQYYMPVPKLLADYCDIQQYNALMRNEPHIQFLKRYFPGQVPDLIFNIFEKIDLQYKLSPAVINVLIHYTIGTNDASRITKAYVESVASNMLLKGIDTYEKAIMYVREQEQMDRMKHKKVNDSQGASGKGYINRANTSKGYNSGKGWNQGRQKPVIPTVSSKSLPANSITPEELEEIMKFAQELENNK